MSAACRPSIYLDHAATTPTDPRVVEVMLPLFTEDFGNPSSSHNFGRRAANHLESARATLSGLLNCKPGELVFTGCGTESDNLALRGAATLIAKQGKTPHFITAKSEHHAVSHTAAQMSGSDMNGTHAAGLTWLDVDSRGMITPDALRSALQTVPAGSQAVVSIMMANNEVGTIQPIRELVHIAHEFGGLFHCDAVQAAGQLPIDIADLNVDLLALTGHKFYGPKGVGLLFIRDGLELPSAQTGGGQENSRRAGTHNTPLIVGMVKALELAYADLPERVASYTRLRDRLIDGVLTRVPMSQLSGATGSDRLPNHASFILESIDANALLMHLDMAGIAASSGSACNTGNPAPSDVLLAMGYPSELALGSLRLTVGKSTTDDEIDYVLDTLPKAVERVRAVRQRQFAHA